MGQIRCGENTTLNATDQEKYCSTKYHDLDQCSTLGYLGEDSASYKCMPD